MIAFTFSQTGGHIYPCIALAQEIPKDKSLLISPDHSVPKTIINKYNLNNIHLPLIAKNPIKFIQNYFKAKKILKKNHIKLLISSGGAFTIPIVLSAFTLKIPIYLLEQNILPGRANKLLSRFATQIYISFQDSQKYFKSKHIILSGNPIRKQFAQDYIYQKFSQEQITNNPTILIFGGSQGAKFINELIFNNYQKLLNKYNIFHITGNDFYKNNFKQPYYSIINSKTSNTQAFIFPFFEKMDYLYQKSNLVISRAGATTIAELIEFQKKAILIPYPYAKDQHQDLNAKIFAQNLLGITIKQKNLTYQNLIQKIQFLEKMPYPSKTKLATKARQKILHQIKRYYI